MKLSLPDLVLVADVNLFDLETLAASGSLSKQPLTASPPIMAMILRTAKRAQHVSMADKHVGLSHFVHQEAGPDPTTNTS